jgi:thiamine phosphate synthase YjbQ (UPF0047 family)
MKFKTKEMKPTQLRIQLRENGKTILRPMVRKGLYKITMFTGTGWVDINDETFGSRSDANSFITKLEESKPGTYIHDDSIEPNATLKSILNHEN